MMNALDHDTSLLQRLVIEGEAVLSSRGLTGGDAGALLDAVRRKREQPFVDGRRVVDDHTMLYVSALALAGKFMAARDPRAAKYRRVVGVLIDDIRDDFARAIEQSKRPTP